MWIDFTSVRKRIYSTEVLRAAFQFKSTLVKLDRKVAVELRFYISAAQLSNEPDLSVLICIKNSLL